MNSTPAGGQERAGPQHRDDFSRRHFGRWRNSINDLVVLALERNVPGARVAFWLTFVLQVATRIAVIRFLLRVGPTVLPSLAPLVFAGGTLAPASALRSKRRGPFALVRQALACAC